MNLAAQRFDQEDATEAFALLTSFQRIGVDSYERVTKAAADLATVTGQDLKGAMTQLSKALEDPARRVTDLARMARYLPNSRKRRSRRCRSPGACLKPGFDPQRDREAIWRRC